MPATVMPAALADRFREADLTYCEAGQPPVRCRLVAITGIALW